MTSNYLNHQRVIRQLVRSGPLSPQESQALWNALVSLQKENDHLRKVLTSLRFQVADGVHALFNWSPALKNSVRWFLRSGRRLLQLWKSDSNFPARGAG